MVTLYIKSEGQDVVMNVIASMAARGVNTRPLMGKLGEIIRGSVTRNFEAEGRPSKWKPLSNLTKEIYEGRALERLEARSSFRKLKREAARERHRTAFLTRHGGRKLLQGEGDLRKSIDVGKITNTSVEVGSSLPYARIHQLGGEIKPKNKKALLVPIGGGRYLQLKKVTIPARPYLVLQDQDGAYILRAAKEYLQEAALHANRGGRYWRK